MTRFNLENEEAFVIGGGLLKPTDVAVGLIFEAIDTSHYRITAVNPDGTFEATPNRITTVEPTEQRSFTPDELAKATNVQQYSPRLWVDDTFVLEGDTWRVVAVPYDPTHPTRAELVI